MHPQPSRQVARHTHVTHGIGAIGRQTDVNNGIFFARCTEVEYVNCRCPDGRFRRQNDNARMVVSDAQFVLRANHALRHFAPNFAFFYRQFFAVAEIQFRSDGRHCHFLPLRHVGRTAHNTEGFARADVHFRKREFVRVRMLAALNDLPDDNAFQVTFYASDGGHAFHFQAEFGEQFSHFFGCFVDVNVLFEPIERDSHKRNLNFEGRI